MPVNSVPPPSSASSARGSPAPRSEPLAAPAAPQGPGGNANSSAASPDQSIRSAAPQQRDARKAIAPATAAAGQGRRGTSGSASKPSVDATQPPPTAASVAPPVIPAATFGQTLASSLSAASSASKPPALPQTSATQPSLPPAGTEPSQQDPAPVKAGGPSAPLQVTRTDKAPAASTTAQAANDDDAQQEPAPSAAAATHSPQLPVLALAAAPGATPAVPVAAAAQGAANQDDSDDPVAPPTLIGHAPAPPLPAQLTVVGSQGDGTPANGQNAGGGAQSGADPNPAGVALNAPTAAVSSHTQSAAEVPTVHAPVGSDAWNNELGARLTLMAQQGVSSASLRLSPAHLGPLEVHISVRDSTASVWFGATQTDTRSALEQALPRLREMFASQGLNLTNAGVSGETPRGMQHNQQSAQAARVDGAREVSVTAVTSAPDTHQGLVDIYA